MKKALVLGVLAIFTIGIANLNAQDRTATPQKPQKTYSQEPTVKKTETKSTPDKKKKTKIDMKGTNQAKAEVGKQGADKNKEVNMGTEEPKGAKVVGTSETNKNVNKDAEVDNTKKNAKKEPVKVIPPKPQSEKSAADKNKGKSNR